MSEGLVHAIDNFERLHDKILDGEYINQYRKFCSNNNVNTLISEAKWACTINGFLTTEEALKYANNLKMNEAILAYEFNKLKGKDPFLNLGSLSHEISKQIYRCVEKMNLRFNMDIFFGIVPEGEIDIDDYITKIYQLYYEYKLKNFHGDFMRELKNNK